MTTRETKRRYEKKSIAMKIRKRNRQKIKNKNLLRKQTKQKIGKYYNKNLIPFKVKKFKLKNIRKIRAAVKQTSKEKIKNMKIENDKVWLMMTKININKICINFIKQEPTPIKAKLDIIEDCMLNKVFSRTKYGNQFLEISEKNQKELFKFYSTCYQPYFTTMHELYFVDSFGLLDWKKYDLEKWPMQNILFDFGEQIFFLKLHYPKPAFVDI